MTDEIKALRDTMCDAAAEAHHAVERFGKDSAQHLALCAAYSTAERAYEAACIRVGVPAYVTYSED